MARLPQNLRAEIFAIAAGEGPQNRPLALTSSLTSEQQQCSMLLLELVHATLQVRGTLPLSLPWQHLPPLP